jgi:hypothetical protein
VDVDGDFDCTVEELQNLMGVHFGKVSGIFFCSYNQLTSLEGAPQEVEGSFSCVSNKLTSLEGAPRRVGGDFSCSNNWVTSLEGAPQEAEGHFFCSGNKLTSLEGAPQKVRGSFHCSQNKLTSLEGSPQEVERNFFFSRNQLTSLKGIPFVNGDISLDLNPIWNLMSRHWGQIEDMEVGSRNLVLQMIGQLEEPTAEDLKRIIRSVDRINMI